MNDSLSATVDILRAEISALRENQERLTVAAEKPPLPPPAAWPTFGEDGPGAETTARPRLEDSNNGARLQDCVGDLGQHEFPSTAIRAEVYTPYSAAFGIKQVKVQEQAKELLDQLRSYSGESATDPAWPIRFWHCVTELGDKLEPVLKAQLTGHGYIGPATRTAPRTADLVTTLQSFANTGAPPHGRALPAQPELQAVDWLQEDNVQYDLKLPSDLQRAAPEIYRNIRGRGYANIRAYLQNDYQGSKDGGVWVDIWNQATLLDARVKQCGTSRAVTEMLATADEAEIFLRRLSALFYEKRTKDTAGAQHMLAIAPPGTSVDIGPTWMVTSATAHSKAEHQRTEKVSHSARRGNQEKGDSKGKKGDGEGKKGKKGSASGAAEVQG